MDGGEEERTLAMRVFSESEEQNKHGGLDALEVCHFCAQLGLSISTTHAEQALEEMQRTAGTISFDTLWHWFIRRRVADRSVAYSVGAAPNAATIYPHRMVRWPGSSVLY